jgi:AcrR family transcriptional regulator
MTQGERTRARLLAATREVLAQRGYRRARVDDIVGRADTSHGTFYLYFANREEAFRALAHAAADDMAALADTVGPIAPGPEGVAELRTFLERFLATYEAHGPVIRAWAENQINDPELVVLGLDTMGGIGAALSARMAEAGVTHLPDPELATTVLLGTVERLVYFLTSRPLALDRAALLDELAPMLHRGFFAPT